MAQQAGGPAVSIYYADVQGTILRGYRVDMARHFVLSITNAAKAGALIAGLVDGTGGLPRITTAERWTEKPECFVNVAFTAAGLQALGLSDLSSFDPSFQAGATNPTIANNVGDVGESAPANWIGGLSNGGAVHVLLSLWVDDDAAVLEKVTATLRAAFAGCMNELSAHNANALPDNHVHFNYRDNIAQPTVLGAPPRKHQIPDDQPVVPTGEFLLGYKNAIGGTYKVKPDILTINSSYAAFRILEQDVAAFEAFLVTYSRQLGINVELLAAKVCGRWRNGNPLELQPNEPGTFLPDSEINNFQYVAQPPAPYGDTLGTKCPIGSHIRRNNPRDEAVIGTDSMHHRIVRRAMPYGPAYDPDKPDSAPVKRGLIGYFINASIHNQFEFLEGQWNLTDQFVMSAPVPPDNDALFNISGQDVFLGVNDRDPQSPNASSFTLAIDGQPNKTIARFSRMITTVGGAYVFFPSITGLRYLAALPQQ
jgi:deferrochelatase/peroxidase EfeB